MTVRSLGDLVIPVTGESNPPDRTVRPDQPEAGARWGRKAAFAFSASGVTESGEGRGGLGFTANLPEDAPPRRRISIGGSVNIGLAGRTITG